MNGPINLTPAAMTTPEFSKVEQGRRPFSEIIKDSRGNGYGNNMSFLKLISQQKPK